MRSMRCGGLLVVLCLLATAAAAQQGASSIRGRILDEQGAVLPGVSLVAIRQDTGTVRQTTSGSDGTYLIEALTPGTYRVTAELEGFRKLTRESLVLAAGWTQTL